MTALQLVSVSERPDLADRIWEVASDWPAFLQNDPVSVSRYLPAIELYPDLHLVALAGEDVVARVHAVPVDGECAENLPDRGWDWALESAVDHPRPDRSVVSLIEIRIRADHRRQGLGTRLVQAVREKFRLLGCTDLVGPVRPNGKADEPRTPTAEYVARTRPDGLPADHWLRVHVRLGGQIVKIAPLSMTIPGTLAQWRRWTGLDFEQDGLIDVPGALTPVLVDTAQQHAVYIEPNVWIRHRL